ncbi:MULTISPECIES: peptide ABC transporter substrate-binding protein [Caproicibacterium]|uniref:Peptide ABC transporter substrate-binding protein n=1 Tax=Caproicibacterium argilliputei TaxID=3030016 RepID=A0AA97D7H7_9FIRM|nr:peptide ABC transporter substrate-binding protein [Caproicibacterium argilliputei]WOC31691.1 peptide ABC transporter substrate-binding protein [Caproicibacterium argilliputei]
MNNAKKFLAVLLAGTMAVSMAACGGTTTSSTSASGTDSSAADSTASGTASTTDTSTSNPFANSQYPGTSDSDSVTLNLGAEPPELNSSQTTDAVSADILRMTIDTLTQLDAKDQPIAGAAKSWDISADKKTYTFHLRDGMKWSNGETVTAKDYLYGWELAMDQSNGSGYGFIIYDNVKGGEDYFNATKTPAAKRTAAEKAKVAAAEKNLGCKVIDDKTIQIEFVNPIPYALQLMSFQTYCPVNQKAYESIGADKYAKEANQIVTNGAYKISEWVHDDHITLVKNNDYWNAKNINIPKVKFVMIKDTNTAMNALKGGQVDCIGLTGDQITQLKNEGQPLVPYEEGTNCYLQYNTKDKILANTKIRQALGMAINTKSFCDDVLKDGSTVAPGLVPGTIGGANGETYAKGRTESYATYDAAKAKTLFEEGLKELGMTKDQLKLTFTCDDTSNSQQDAAFLQEQWKSTLGITIDLKAMPFKSRIKAMDDGDFQIVMALWAPDYNDALTYLDMWMTDNGNNYGKYSNPEYDKLVKAAIAESDSVKRQDDLLKAEKLVVETDCAAFPLYFRVKTYTCSKKLSGLTRTPFQEFDVCDGAKINTAG